MADVLEGGDLAFFYRPRAEEEAGLAPRQRADYPPALAKRSGGRRWIGADPPELLDHPGAKLVLITLAPEPADELGVALPTGAESESSADVFSELRIRRGRDPLQPLFEGTLE